MKSIRFLSLALLIAAISPPAPAAPLQPGLIQGQPKLVLVVVFDQFRADYLTRFQKRFLPATSSTGVGGFQYLLANGATFFHAQYELLQNMTCPGHATILTGSYPYQNGVPTNYWYDPVTNEKTYCAEDPASRTVGVEKEAPHLGTSPKNLRGTTVGDELKNAGYPSRVVTLALKDRAAIMLGGHAADLALWIDQQSMRWVSSRYYLPEGKLPSWVDALNQKLAEGKGKTMHWEAQGPGVGLSLADSLGKPTKMMGGGFGSGFPHDFPLDSASALASPFGVDITEAAAEHAITAFHLGGGKGPDLLGVSFSSHDYVGHAFGPNSREMEEMTVHEDQSLAKLLNFVNRAVPGGLKQVTIILTADHGMPPNPDYLRRKSFDAGHVDEGELTKNLETALKDKFGEPAGGRWLAGSLDFNIKFSTKAFEGSKTTKTAAEDFVRDYLLEKVPGVAFAFTATDYAARKLPPGLFEKQILKTYVPGRSGDVVGILKPFFAAAENPVDHMTGYSYDRTVPLIMAGAHIHPGLYATPANTVDVAPTLSFLLGLIPPSQAEGRILEEILGR